LACFVNSFKFERKWADEGKKQVISFKFERNGVKKVAKVAKLQIFE
jgi:hypothetical protein